MIQTLDQFRAMLAAERGQTKPMTSTEYRAAIASIGLTQEAAGLFFGRSVRAGQRWALHEIEIPATVQWCLEWMAANGVKATDLEEEKA